MDTRITVNGDFTVVVPGGMTWSTQPEQIGKNWLAVFMADTKSDFTDPLHAGRSFAVEYPQPLREKDFADPVIRGAIRNFAAGALEERYHQEVRQVVVKESSDLMVLYAKKVGKDGAVRFVIAASKGLYTGLICPDARTEKERFEIVADYLNSVEKFTPAVKPLVPRRPEDNLLGARPEAATKEEAAAKPKESEIVPDPADDVKDVQPEEKDSAENSEKVTLEIPIVAPGDNTLEIANAMVEQLVAEVESDAKAALEAGGKLDVYDKQIEHMKELERIRAEKIAEIRSHYAGNPDVEAQIDNYIPRVQRSADRACEEFQKFLTQMQAFIAGIPLTGPEDPTYLEIAQRIEEAQDTMGKQLDEMVIGVDENATNSKKAGITEYYVERMIRLIERLEEKYDELDVGMYDGSTMRYQKPGDVLTAISKWKNVRYELPTYIERSEREVEKRADEEVTRRLERTRMGLRNQEAYIELKIEEVSRAEDTLAAMKESLEEFDAGFETRKTEAEAAGAKILIQNDAEVKRLQDELAKEERELEELTEELGKTFALNVNKKKDLTMRIDVQNGRISELKARIQNIMARRPELEQAGSRKTQEMSAERKSILGRIEEAEKKVAALHEELDQAEKRLSELRTALKESEEEKSKIHENYLLGKYDTISSF